MKVFERVKRAAGDTTSTGNLVDAVLTAGQIVETKSYYGTSTTDTAGAARYKIVTAAEYGGTPDEYGDHTLVNGSVAVLLGQVINAKAYGMRDGTGFDNSLQFAALTQNIKNGTIVDFQGGEYRIFEGVYGIASATADPAVDRAITEDKLPILLNKRDIIFRNGTVYVADQKVAAVKTYYPCTLSIQECENIVLENMTLESKGESYGDADASVSLDRDGRMNFLPYNSGNALVISRSRDVYMYNCRFRLAGSVGALYISSSAGVVCHGCFANVASLGYAGYAIDAWIGQENITGFRRHDTELTDCTCYKESLVARDTSNSVGSSIYGSKGCVATEDSSVFVSVNGGYYADAYANGSSRDIGNAFGANACEVTVNGAYVENCACIGITGQSADVPGKLVVANVAARNIRKTMHQVSQTSFNSQYFEYSNCDVEINDSGVWPDDGNRAREYSSVVANMKAGSAVFGKISNCRITGPQAVWINDAVSYGYLMISNCYITTDGWLALSNGWGGAGPDYSQGVFIADTNIEDISAETEAYLQYTNKDPSNAFSHINLDFSSSTLTTAQVRIAYSLSAEGSDLVRTLVGFDKLLGAWSPSPWINTGVHPIVYKEQRGLAGANRKVVFEYPNREAFLPMMIPDATTEAPNNIVRAVAEVGPAVVNASGNVEQEWFIHDSFTLWSVGQRLPGTYIASYPTVAP